MGDCNVLNFDGTGYFSSKKLYSDACINKVNSKIGEITCYLQAVRAVIVHPDHKIVIQLYPEIITRQYGKTKNDCGHNAVKQTTVVGN